ncbi:amidohydrolase family protein [Jatrophihabitans sp. DSM 45814]
MSTFLDEVRVIDTDTHLVEPPDLWTSRMSTKKYGDLVPHVKWDDKGQDEAWFMGDQRVLGVSEAGTAGWSEYPPLHPTRFSDADPAMWNPTKRLERMDSDGIWAQVLYPNVGLFKAASIRSVSDAGFQLEVVRAYNDHQTEFASADPRRLVPVTSLPFWDLDETLAEIERCAAMEHKGIVFTQNPASFGLPELVDPHWDRMWASAQEKGLSVNFHIASSSNELSEEVPRLIGKHANYAAISLSFFMGNGQTISHLICGGICHRFPDLKFVSVESGIGWLPFLLEGLDWQWKNCGVPSEHPEYDLLPSEYFRRQIYGCFWFEEASAEAAIKLIGADNILYETDFPHPSSMSPGPASSAVPPRSYISKMFANLDEASAQKILHDNAASLYHLD